MPLRPGLYLVRITGSGASEAEQQGVLCKLSTDYNSGNPEGKCNVEISILSNDNTALTIVNGEVVHSLIDVENAIGYAEYVIQSTYNTVLDGYNLELVTALDAEDLPQIPSDLHNEFEIALGEEVQPWSYVVNQYPPFHALALIKTTDANALALLPEFASGILADIKFNVGDFAINVLDRSEGAGDFFTVNADGSYKNFHTDAAIAEILSYVRRIGLEVYRTYVESESDINAGDMEYAGGSIETLIPYAYVVIAGSLPEPPAPTVKAVDLRLPSGTLWANMNVGASAPEEAGLYFQWGNVDGVREGDSYNFTQAQYATTPGAVLTDDIVQGGDNDAAAQILGDGWVMPNQSQVQELVNSEYVSKEIITEGNTEVLKITSLTNGNSIMIPMVGYISGVSIQDSLGYIWECGFDSERYAIALCIPDDDDINPSYGMERYDGIPIRPVKLAQP